MSLDRISKVGAQIELSNTSQENGESLRPPTLQQPSKLTDVSLATQQSVPESITSTCTSQRETTCGARDGRQECLDFEIGSLVQVNDPPLYGVIRVMCAVPKIQGIAAGIELVSQSMLFLCLLYVSNPLFFSSLYSHCNELYTFNCHLAAFFSGNNNRHTY